MAYDNDLKFLELARPEQQADQVQNALKCDVKNRQDHGASEESTTGALFYADRVFAPYRRFVGQRSVRPVTLVMLDEDSQGVLTMLVAQDQQPIETL